jgi:hypothetical protein
MYGGAQQQTDMFLLGDVGDYTDVGDLIPFASASLVGLDIGLLLSRFAGLGGLSANAYFDTLGLEGVLATLTLLFLVFQLSRWIYTTVYMGKPWSPFVFVCILIAIQAIHDLIVSFGVLKNIPAGKNEMVDLLKRYAVENGSRALTGHMAILIVIGVLSMILKESSTVFVFLVTAIAAYALCFLLTTVGPKPPAPPPPPPKKDPFQQRLIGPQF